MINFDKIFDKVFPNKNKVIINGKNYEVSGNNFSVVQSTSKSGTSKVVVNGITIVDEIVGHEVTVKWEGELANLDCTSAEINGNVTGNVDCTKLKCGMITGEVNATSVDSGDINGNVSATSVKANNIKGDVEATSVTYKK